MSTTPPITAWVPKVSANPQPDEIHRHLTLLFQKSVNHTTAFGLLTQKVNAIKYGASTTIEEGGGVGGSIIPYTPPPGIPVNDQSGVTSYATAASDNGALIVLSDASAVAVTLTPQTPPWGCFIANQGTGTATLTPGINGAMTPTISYAGNPGAASMPLPGGYGCLVGFDGSSWFALTMPIVPLTFNAVTHEFLTSYDAATGDFTAARPAYSDLTGTPTLPTTIAPVAGEYLTGYDASTGNFSQSTPAGLSVTITTAALTSLGTQGSMTFVGGLLVSQVQAT